MTRATPDMPRDPESSARPVSAFTGAVIVICALVETTFVLGDIGIISVPRLRLLGYEYAGFWPGLLRDWHPNYAAQPYLMFLTYGFLHGGPIHFAVNMLTLMSLGETIAARVGQLRYGILYFASILGGAVAFGLLSPEPRPMVGASGALFGLAGAILAWEFQDRRRAGQSQAAVWRLAAILVVLNIVLWWAMDGQLAWQTHLGGFLSGAVLAGLFRSR